MANGAIGFSSAHHPQQNPRRPKRPTPRKKVQNVAGLPQLNQLQNPSSVSGEGGGSASGMQHHRKPPKRVLNLGGGDELQVWSLKQF